jgi:hypothetical protein
MIHGQPNVKFRKTSMRLSKEMFCLPLHLLIKFNTNLPAETILARWMILRAPVRLHSKLSVPQLLTAPVFPHWHRPESQMTHLNTKPLDILWSSRDGSISIEFMLQAQWRNKTLRSLEGFFPPTKFIPDIGFLQWPAFHYCRD